MHSALLNKDMKKLKIVPYIYTLKFLHYNINLKCKEYTTQFFPISTGE